eukprot:2087409-Prymnesium_polylepis.1
MYKLWQRVKSPPAAVAPNSSKRRATSSMTICVSGTQSGMRCAQKAVTVERARAAGSVCTDEC